jgi:SAM-dependent methyltransferase
MYKLRRLLKKIFRHYRPVRSKYFSSNKSYFRNRIGLEIGGPSSLFSDNGRLPAYSIAKCIDNCNFGNSTVWEGDIVQGRTFVFNSGKPPGQQYILEASSLVGIPCKTYDFVLSSHCIEHIANPIKALIEWKRVLKKNGVLLLVVPHKNNSFDRKRDVTAFDHLLYDFDHDTGEDDQTHLNDVLENHDFECDTVDFQSLKDRSLHNIDNRCLHHHVFDCDLVDKMVQYAGFKIMAKEIYLGIHIVVFAQKN